jgi:hypothetical protein
MLSGGEFLRRNVWRIDWRNLLTIPHELEPGV